MSTEVKWLVIFKRTQIMKVNLGSPRFKEDIVAAAIRSAGDDPLTDAQGVMFDVVSKIAMSENSRGLCDKVICVVNVAPNGDYTPQYEVWLLEPVFPVLISQDKTPATVAREIGVDCLWHFDLTPEE